MREQVGESPPRLEERKGASEYFLAFALLHAGCGDEVIEARLDKRTLACWCLRCDELRIIGDPVVGTMVIIRCRGESPDT